MNYVLFESRSATYFYFSEYGSAFEIETQSNFNLVVFVINGFNSKNK